MAAPSSQTKSGCLKVILNIQVNENDDLNGLLGTPVTAQYVVNESKENRHFIETSCTLMLCDLIAP